MDERAFARVAEEYAGRPLLGGLPHARPTGPTRRTPSQRALLKCFAARTSYSPQWAVSTWLYRALTNVCIDELRRRRVRADDTDPGREAGSGVRSRAKRGGIETVASTPPTPIAQRVDLTRALDIVPARRGCCWPCTTSTDSAIAQLAEIRGISVNTVKSQLARGKAILKQALQAGGHHGSD